MTNSVTGNKDMLLLGDAHAEEREKKEKLLNCYHESDEGLALQVGDLGYYEPPKPTWFIAGNNEDFDVIDRLREERVKKGNGGLDNLHLVSEPIEIEGLSVAGISGNYAPNYYGKSRDELVGDRRRHFVEKEVERAKSFDDVDVFLSHQPPHGVLVKGGYDVGVRPVDEILDAVEPRLCLTGHHHTHKEALFGRTRVVSLAPTWEAYYEMGSDLRIEKYDVSP
ncbi:MAG: metallophosphoesterase [Halobacteria archaeon]